MLDRRTIVRVLVGAVLLGGVSRRVTAEAHCPVIILARGAEDGLEALVDDGAG